MKYTTTQAAYLMGVSRQTVYNLMTSGELPYQCASNNKPWRRVLHEDLRSYMVQHKYSLDRIDLLNPYTRNPEQVSLMELYDFLLELSESQSPHGVEAFLSVYANNHPWARRLLTYYNSSTYEGISLRACRSVVKEYLAALFNGYGIRPVPKGK